MTSLRPWRLCGEISILDKNDFPFFIFLNSIFFSTSCLRAFDIIAEIEPIDE